MISIVNEANFHQEVLTAKQPVLVHFWTPWCGLCRLIEPILSKLSKENNSSIKLVAINADENFKIANHYCIHNLPTIMLFHDGKPVQKMDMFENRDRLKAALEKVILDTPSLS